MSSINELNDLSYSIGINWREEDLPIGEFNEKLKNLEDMNAINKREEAKLRLLRAKQVKGRAARNYCERKKMKEVRLDADVRVLQELKRLYIKEKKCLRQEIYFIIRLQSVHEPIRVIK